MHIKVFLPDSLLQSDGCFLRGYYVPRGSELDIYVTAHSTDYNTLTNSCISSSECLYGRLGACNKLPLPLTRSTIDITASNEFINISRLVIDYNNIGLRENNVVILYYDLETVSRAEKWPVKDRTFYDLHGFLAREQSRCMKTPEITSSELDVDDDKGVWSWLRTSVFLRQLRDFIDMISWILLCIRLEKRVTIKAGNLIAALVTDILIGYWMLSLLSVPSDHLVAAVMAYIETPLGREVMYVYLWSDTYRNVNSYDCYPKRGSQKSAYNYPKRKVVVNYLRSLLKWLMGAPAGLKLNNAFNNMLGKFFLYHIELWWMFLELTKGGLHAVFMLYYHFGYLGITFQAAVVSDMISFISFHAYCIYVYAARLFNIQVSGLGALLRLFVGRKQNPLRGGVDSCEYTNQELFVGTVAFTVLLFLLPTTALYYTVFTLFRLLSLAVQGSLVRLCHTVRSLPLCVVFLWLIGSPRIAGDVHMDVLQGRAERSALLVRVTFPPLSLGSLVRAYRPPPLRRPPRVPWTDVLSKVLRGNLISSR